VERATIVCRPDPGERAKFWRYAAAVLFENASTFRVSYFVRETSTHLPRAGPGRSGIHVEDLPWSVGAHRPPFSTSRPSIPSLPPLCDAIPMPVGRLGQKKVVALAGRKQPQPNRRCTARSIEIQQGFYCHSRCSRGQKEKKQKTLVSYVTKSQSRIPLKSKIMHQSQPGHKMGSVTCVTRQLLE